MGPIRTVGSIAATLVFASIASCGTPARGVHPLPPSDRSASWSRTPRDIDAGSYTNPNIYYVGFLLESCDSMVTANGDSLWKGGSPAANATVSLDSSNVLQGIAGVKLSMSGADKEGIIYRKLDPVGQANLHTLKFAFYVDPRDWPGHEHSAMYAAAYRTFTHIRMVVCEDTTIPPERYGTFQLGYEEIMPGWNEKVFDCRGGIAAGGWSPAARQRMIGFEVHTAAAMNGGGPIDVTFDDIIRDRKAKPKVTLEFHDTRRDHLTTAFPILKKYGFPGVELVDIDHVGNRADYLTLAQLNALYRNGWDCISHRHVVPCGRLSRSALEASYGPVLRYVAEHFPRSAAFAQYGYHCYDSAVVAWHKEHYRLAVGGHLSYREEHVNVAERGRPEEDRAYHYPYMDGDALCGADRVGEVTRAILDTVAAQGTWLILGFHEIHGPQLDTICACIRESRIPVVTFSEYFARRKH